LDKFAVVLAKTSAEVVFRFQMARAALQVVFIQGVGMFPQSLLAEGEAARHMVRRRGNTKAKVRALDIDNGNSDGKKGKTVEVNRAARSLSLRRGVILPMEAIMD
jgi:hypothetical protein